MTKKTKLQADFDLARKQPLAQRSAAYARGCAAHEDFAYSQETVSHAWEAGYRSCLRDCRAALFSGHLFNLLRPRKR